MMKYRRHSGSERGTTLLELTIAVSLFLVIAGPIIGALANAQKNYRSSEISVALEQNMRAALELMQQEISQAGLQPSGVDNDGLGQPLATVDPSACSTGTPATCITANPTTPVWIPVSTVAGLYQWEKVRVGAGPGPDCSVTGECEKDVEIRQIDASSSPPKIYALFLKNHTTQDATKFPVPIYGMGTYPQGILPPAVTVGGVSYSASTQSGGSTATQLEIFGDLNGSGNTLQMVQYKCPTAQGGSFTRTLYSIGATGVTQLQTTNLIDNVVWTNGQVQCNFTYPPNTSTQPWPVINNVSPCETTSSSEPIITSVGFTITAQSNMPDVRTGKPVQITKSYLNIQPRNIVAALNAVTSTAYSGSEFSLANELQPNPKPGVSTDASNGCQVLP